ncbi:unnamed protein product [Ophioblennius macclurei]
MSVDATKLFFEGFLQKRKDSLKIWWVTYWFRLQNTTLFFYTQKNGSALHLRGIYYIYTVQSVRAVDRADKKRFIFEIIMTNGKRKVLAAETQALRKEWIDHLWQAMHLSTSGVVDYRATHRQVDEQQANLNSNTRVSSDQQEDEPIYSDADSVLVLLPGRRFSAPVTSNPVDPEAWGKTSPVCQPDVGIYQTVDFPHQNPSEDDLTTQWSSGVNNNNIGNTQGDYDVLPLRKQICVLKTSAEDVEPIYDSPLSHKTSLACQEPADNIYDMPCSLLRKRSFHTIDDKLEEEEDEKESFWRL